MKHLTALQDLFQAEVDQLNLGTSPSKLYDPSIDDNPNWKHFMHSTNINLQIPSREPALGDIFSEYWAEVGR